MIQHLDDHVISSQDQSDGNSDLSDKDMLCMMLLRQRSAAGIERRG
jgi:hypothetical protein